MAGSADRDDGAMGCAALLGIIVAAVVCWLVWQAVVWTFTEWRWAWFVGYTIAVPAVAYGIVRAWGEERPFVPSRQREAWATAVLTALAATAPVVVLVKGWATGVVALLFAIGSGIVGSFVSSAGRRGPGDEKDAAADPERERTPSDASLQAE
ncbi:hypothetical protein [Streptomyces mirabilis]|uniref:hypothetical protein n=1 Tax=Streptomyces mirabilis TaxID=68239 RepID=UPI003801A2A4